MTTEWRIVVNMGALKELDQGMMSFLFSKRVAKRDLPYRLPLGVDE